MDKYINRRTEIAEYYGEKLNFNNFSSLEQKNDRRSSWHLYIIRISNGKKHRNNLVDVLIKNGIGVNLHYIPVYRHPYSSFKGKLDGAEKYYDSALTIPLFPSMSFKDVDCISSIINKNLDD